MSTVIVERSGQRYGPYSANTLETYVVSGELLRNDWVISPSGDWEGRIPLSAYLKSKGLKTHAQRSGKGFGGSVHELKELAGELIWPWRQIRQLEWIQDRKFLTLSGLGLLPMFAMSVFSTGSLLFWAVALYSAFLWGWLYYSQLATKEAQVKLCVICFLGTAFVAIPAWLFLQSFPPWSLLMSEAIDGGFFGQAIGNWLGVGFHEELAKAAVIFWVITRPGAIYNPRTVVLYGLMCGLGFGIHEGVFYQQEINPAAGVNNAYFLNIARLTSLPFLHSVWGGISAYYLGFASLYPARRFGLWFFGLLIPATLHATHNMSGFGLVGLCNAAFSVLLLLFYLDKAKDMQSALSLLKP
ncbi:PrsW family glutamic-type intramembrane protease [bacterium]|nr:PrsW family glutamic-type intramembrane protease [bacterium]